MSLLGMQTSQWLPLRQSRAHGQWLQAFITVTGAFCVIVYGLHHALLQTFALLDEVTSSA
jgi:hypothetical protein